MMHCFEENKSDERKKQEMSITSTLNFSLRNQNIYLSKVLNKEKELRDIII